MLLNVIFWARIKKKPLEQIAQRQRNKFASREKMLVENRLYAHKMYLCKALMQVLVQQSC